MQANALWYLAWAFPSWGQFFLAWSSSRRMTEP